MAVLFSGKSCPQMIVEEGDVTEEDEDDEDGIRFVTLESCLLAFIAS